jgi:hypothetical protein
MIESFVETLEAFSPEEISNACKVLGRRDNPFPPSAGEIYCECIRVRGIAIEEARRKVPKLERKPRGIDAVPESERAAMREKVAKLLAEFKSEVAN